LLTIVGLSASILHLNWIVCWVFVGCSIVVFFASGAAIPIDTEIAKQQKADEKEQKQERITKE
jgi:hypothetical protein